MLSACRNAVECVVVTKQCPPAHVPLKTSLFFHQSQLIMYKRLSQAEGPNSRQTLHCSSKTCSQASDRTALYLALCRESWLTVDMVLTCQRLVLDRGKKVLHLVCCVHENVSQFRSKPSLLASCGLVTLNENAMFKQKLAHASSEMICHLAWTYMKLRDKSYQSLAGRYGGR